MLYEAESGVRGAKPAWAWNAYWPLGRAGTGFSDISSWFGKRSRSQFLLAFLAIIALFLLTKRKTPTKKIMIPIRIPAMPPPDRPLLLLDREPVEWPTEGDADGKAELFAVDERVFTTSLLAEDTGDGAPPKLVEPVLSLDWAETGLTTGNGAETRGVTDGAALVVEAGAGAAGAAGAAAGGAEDAAGAGEDAAGVAAEVTARLAAM